MSSLISMANNNTMKLIEMRRSDSHVDVTDSVECYKNGKTFECECGHGIGVEFDVEAVVCQNCGKVCVDRLVDSREAPNVEEGQATLAQF